MLVIFQQIIVRKILRIKYGKTLSVKLLNIGTERQKSKLAIFIAFSELFIN